MSINKMAGWCLILLGVVNVLHEISLTSSGRGKPGLGYALITSIFFTAGAVLLCWKGIRKGLAKHCESGMTGSAESKRTSNHL